MITSAIMFLTNGDTELGFPRWVQPQFQQHRQDHTQQPSKQPGLRPARPERVSEIEANGGLNTFHCNGLQQSQLHICNHSFFNLILVSNTFSGPNTSKKCHHLIGRYSMPGLETADWMCWVFTWIWIRVWICISERLYYLENMAKPGFSQREMSAWGPVVSLPWEGRTACPWDDLEADGINQGDSVHSHPLRFKLSFWIKYVSDHWLISEARIFYLETRAIFTPRGQG